MQANIAPAVAVGLAIGGVGTGIAIENEVEGTDFDTYDG